MAKTMFITQEGPANALALNKDNTQVVIAGRNVFKVFNIEEEELVETCNLRVGKNLNHLNFSCNDVAWSTNEDHILATAATNGAVVMWNLNRQSRSKQEHVFVDHKRTVNKVSFHSIEPSRLISGSQDGTMKTFDLRIKEATRTFYSNTESVRDVQFSPHSQHNFAAVSENGSVQLWDVRRPDKCYHQFTAHSGPIFACDWHPEHAWLATASRDKTIKVWDLVNKPAVEFTINTIASVGRVKWRPQRTYHIASVALVVDCSVNVWDVRRPYIPFASFNEHKDVATGIAWRGHPHTFLSTSRDCTLYHHLFKDATRPASKANPQGVAFNSRGDLAYACKANNNLLAKSGKTAANSRRSDQSSDEFVQASSHMHWYNKKMNLENIWFVGCASQYLLSGRPLPDLCDHNAAVAENLGRTTVSLVWRMIKILYAPRLGDFGLQMGAKGDGEREGGGTLKDKSDKDGESDKKVGVEEREGEGSSEEGNKKSKRQLRLEDLKTGTDSMGDFFFGDGEMDPLSMDFERGNSVGLCVDIITHDWTLPIEAFPLRHEIQDSSPPPEQLNNDSPEPSDETQLLTIEDPPSSLLTVNWVTRAPMWDSAGVMCAALRHHANAGDVQTCASVLIALGEKRRSLSHVLDEAIQEHWLTAYIDILTRHQLWDVATQVIQLSWIASVYQLNQQSTLVNLCCTKCNKTLLRSGWLCDSCRSVECAVCSVCHKVVKGLYSWCQGCAHGGHMKHIQEWLENYSECPAGCGHQCEYT
ncbi:GATOR complex protein WDR24 [Nilaparvata lugens]|uniref:GATOR complex protein WDR24 n=1 Tax=Nilaparvata lugens TaxID=108931 RepID=UPI000B998629|nr:GATOR complex protein WDR24 [Nilaparvata lugens]